MPGNDASPLKTLPLTIDEADRLMRQKYVENLESTLSKDDLSSFLKHRAQERITSEMQAMLPHVPNKVLRERCLYIANAMQNKIQTLPVSLRPLRKGPSGPSSRFSPQTSNISAPHKRVKMTTGSSPLPTLSSKACSSCGETNNRKNGRNCSTCLK